MDISSTSSSVTQIGGVTRPYGDSRSRPSDEAQPEQGRTHSTTDPSSQDLDEEEQARVTELQQRDREVRAHEAAHLAAAGSYAQGGAEFSYERGPNGQQYAVGGEVSIDTSPIAGDPQATLQKALQIQRAALAPADPSGQDRRVAAEAAAMAAEARQEVAQQSTTPENKPSSKAGADEAASSDPGKALMERIKQDGALSESASRATTASLHLLA